MRTNHKNARVPEEFLHKIYDPEHVITPLLERLPKQAYTDPRYYTPLSRYGMRVLKTHWIYSKHLVENVGRVLQHHPEQYEEYLRIGARLAENPSKNGMAAFLENAPWMMDYPRTYQLYLDAGKTLLDTERPAQDGYDAQSQFIIEAPLVLKDHTQHYRSFIRDGLELNQTNPAAAALFFAIARNAIEHLPHYDDYSKAVLRIARSSKTTRPHNSVIRFLKGVNIACENKDCTRYIQTGLRLWEHDPEMGDEFITNASWLLNGTPELYAQYERISLTVAQQGKMEAAMWFETMFDNFKTPNQKTLCFMDCVEGLLDAGVNVLGFIHRAPRALRQVSQEETQIAGPIAALMARTGHEPTSFLDGFHKTYRRLGPHKEPALEATLQIARKDGEAADGFFSRIPELLIKQRHIPTPERLLLDYIHDPKSANVIGRVIDRTTHRKEYARKIRRFY